MYRPFQDIFNPPLGDPIDYFSCGAEDCENTNCRACAHPSAWNYLPNSELEGNYIPGNYANCDFLSDFISFGCPYNEDPNNPDTYSLNPDQYYIDYHNNAQSVYEWFLDDWDGLAYQYYMDNFEVMQQGGVYDPSTGSIPPPRMIYSHNCIWDVDEYVEPMRIHNVNLYIRVPCMSIPENCPLGYDEISNTYLKHYGTATEADLMNGIPLKIPFDSRIVSKINAGEDLEISIEFDFGSSSFPLDYIPTDDTAIGSYYIFMSAIRKSGQSDATDNPEQDDMSNTLGLGTGGSFPFIIEQEEDINGNFTNKAVHTYSFPTTGENSLDIFAAWSNGEINDDYWINNSPGGSNDSCGGILPTRMVTSFQLFYLTIPPTWFFNNTVSYPDNPPDGCDNYMKIPLHEPMVGTATHRIAMTMPLLIDFVEREFQGDMTGDNSYNVLDIVALLDCVTSATCADQYGGVADINSDGSYNILDVQALASCVQAANCFEVL